MSCFYTYRLEGRVWAPTHWAESEEELEIRKKKIDR